MPGPQDPHGKSLGMGGEAFESEHAVQQEAKGQAPSPAAASQENAARTGPDDGAGSEPLVDRETQHVPGYGGRLGAPRVSADEREPEDPTGTVPGGRATPS